MSYTQLLKSVAEGLKTAYQLSEDDIANILPEKEEDFKAETFTAKFLELDKDRIQTIHMKGKDKFDQGYGKAKKEALTVYENEIRSTFGIDEEDLQGIDLVNKVIEINSAKTKGDASKLTEDELKSHPSVIKILNEKDRAFKEQEQLIKSEFEQKLQGLNKAQLFGKVSKKGLSILDSMNPVLSQDPVRATNQKNWLIRELEQYDFQDEGNHFIPLKDGKRVEDGHGHGVNYEQLVQNIAKGLYDFKQADDRSAPPAGGGSGGGGAVPKFKNEAEYAAFVTNSDNSLEDRQRAREDWNKQAAS